MLIVQEAACISGQAKPEGWEEEEDEEWIAIFLFWKKLKWKCYKKDRTTKLYKKNRSPPKKGWRFWQSGFCTDNRIKITMQLVNCMKQKLFCQNDFPKNSVGKTREMRKITKHDTWGLIMVIHILWTNSNFIFIVRVNFSCVL